MSRQHLNRVYKNGAPKPKKGESVDWSEPFKSNFDEVVKNIALESKKSNYNPKIDMNWCYLPTEMRYECVKRMDFKTRCGFRGVSKSEKTLVELEKYQFKHLQITFKPVLVGGGSNWKVWNIIAKSGNGKSEIYIRTNDCLNEKCLSAIFKHAEVKNLRLLNGPLFGYRVRPIMEQLEKFAPFPFKRVAVFNNPFIEFFMRNCQNLEKIDVSLWLPYKEVLNLPSLLKVKEFKFLYLSQSYLLHFLPELVQKWIENDAEVGKSVQFKNRHEGIVNMIAEKFADRIIEKTDKELRIRMNNEKTQILIRSLDSEKYFWGTCFCSCKVVPIDLQKSKYQIGDEWIQAVYERSLKSLGKLENAMEFDAEDQAIWGDEL